MGMLACPEKAAVVIDVGSGFTKIGFGSNVNPTFVVPTAVATRPVTHKTERPSEMDFHFGDEALQRVPLYDVSYPVKRGVVADWSLFEKVICSSVCRYLQVDATEHPFVLTEPPLNPPENRESLAEIMFEMLGVPRLHIGVQAVLALYGMHAMTEQGSEGGRAGARHAGMTSLQNLTGTVVEAGDGATHVVPVVNGYVVGSSIASMPVGGSNLTALVQALQRERREALPAHGSMDVCRAIKERYCYTARDAAQEAAKMAADPARYVRQHVTQHMTQQGPREVSVSVAHERFLAPEAFFQPALVGAECPSLPALIDGAIQSCAIDSRRALYGSVYLSGGSTMFKHFDKRLQLEIQKTVDSRLVPESTGVAVKVARHPLQQHSVWFGGSLLSTAPGFLASCHTKAQYEEYGPSICRANHVYNDER